MDISSPFYFHLILVSKRKAGVREAGGRRQVALV